MSRRQQERLRAAIHLARRGAAEHERGMLAVGEIAATSGMSLAEIACAIDVSPRSVGRWRDRYRRNVTSRVSHAAHGVRNVSRTSGRIGPRERENALRAIRSLAEGGVAPKVSAYRSTHRKLDAPSFTATIAAFGSWANAVRAAGLEPRPEGRPRKRAS